ncbi:tripartite motif-containing protein 2-like [Ptychodera flava]|uniref:tripartite motif-containing protein 2-like n=1 Tax=Ptychodera flava TaxID=63121 RepID=UPI00396AA62B
MAAKTSKLPSEIDENFLLCGICYERYKNAKILPCLHSFCEPCLSKLAEENGTITCPVCRRVHELTDSGVAGIEANVFLNDLLVYFAEQGGDELNKCTACEDGKVTTRCIECAYHICFNCAKAHAKFPSTKSHRLLKLDEYHAAVSDDTASVQPPAYCNAHAEYQVEFYCDTCEIAICPKCTALDHPQTKHQYRHVNDAAKDFAGNLSTAIEKMKVKETEANNSKITAQGVLQSLDKSYQREEETLRKHTRQTIQEVTRLIQEDENKLLTELKGEYDKRKGNLTAQIKELDIAESDLTITREYVEKLMHYGNASQLMSAKKGVDHQTEELLKVKTQVEPVEDDYMEFRPFDDFCSDKSIGMIKFIQTVYKVDTVARTVRVGEEITCTIRSEEESILDMEKVSLSAKVEAVMKKPDGTPQEMKVKDNENGTMTLKTRVEEVGEHELSVSVCRKSVLGSPVRVNVIAKKGLVCKFGESGSGVGQLHNIWGMVMMENGDTLVGEYKNKRLQSFTVDRRHRKLFRFLNVNNFRPYDAAVSVNGNIFTTDGGNKKVIVCDENGKLIKCFGKGQFQCPVGIAINPLNGRVYVVDYTAHCIHIYDQEGNHIKSFGSYGSQEGQFHHPLFVCINNTGVVYVSEYSNHRIQAFNGDGHFLYTFGSYGSGDGQLNHPRGVAVDKHGYVYVADQSNNRIVKYESRGQFVCRIDDVGDSLNRPIGVCVTDDDRVIVADKGNNCIKVFAQ